MGTRKFSENCFRAYKKINRVEYQEYFTDELAANKRQQELDDLAFIAGTLEHFLFEPDTHKSLSHSRSLGCKYLTYQIVKPKRTRSNDRLRLEFRVHAVHNKNIVSRSFNPNKLGWEQALYDALEFAISCYEKNFKPLSSLDKSCIREWVRSPEVEAAIASKAWSEISNLLPKEVVHSTRAVLNNKARFISVATFESGTPCIRLTASKYKLSKTQSFCDFKAFYEALCYYSYLVIRNMDTIEERTEYLLAVYFTLITAWHHEISNYGYKMNDTVGEFKCFERRVYNYIH